MDPRIELTKLANSKNTEEVIKLVIFFKTWFISLAEIPEQVIFRHLLTPGAQIYVKMLT